MSNFKVHFVAKIQVPRGMLLQLFDPKLIWPETKLMFLKEANLDHVPQVGFKYSDGDWFTNPVVSIEYFIKERVFGVFTDDLAVNDVSSEEEFLKTCDHLIRLGWNPGNSLTGQALKIRRST
jgi:hypothetical protein